MKENLVVKGLCNYSGIQHEEGEPYNLVLQQRAQLETLYCLMCAQVKWRIPNSTTRAGIIRNHRMEDIVVALEKRGIAIPAIVRSYPSAITSLWKQLTVDSKFKIAIGADAVLLKAAADEILTWFFRNLSEAEKELVCTSMGCKYTKGMSIDSVRSVCLSAASARCNTVV